MSDQEKNPPAGPFREANRQGNLSTLIIGVVIGAALTYLLTTKKGQKIKERLLTEGRKLLEELGEEASQVKEKIAASPDGPLARKEEEKEEIPDHITQIQKKGRRFFFRRSHSAES